VDGRTFDRIAKALSGMVPRREAVRAVLGTGAAAATAQIGLVATAARQRRKKKVRCRKPGEVCGGKKKCCTKNGPAVCQAFGSPQCRGVDLTGNRCCGQEGALCDPDFGTPLEMTPNSRGNCSCCSPLFCGRQMDGSFRCQTEET
jgi:hypothetical protein